MKGSNEANFTTVFRASKTFPRTRKVNQLFGGINSGGEMSTQNIETPTLAASSRLLPRRKVAVGGLAGSLSIVLVWILNKFVMPSGESVPSEIASALTMILTFVVSYLVTEPGFVMDNGHTKEASDTMDEK
jgi:hypothetical protein